MYDKFIWHKGRKYEGATFTFPPSSTHYVWGVWLLLEIPCMVFSKSLSYDCTLDVPGWVNILQLASCLDRACPGRGLTIQAHMMVHNGTHQFCINASYDHAQSLASFEIDVVMKESRSLKKVNKALEQWWGSEWPRKRAKWKLGAWPTMDTTGAHK